ncbi:DNA-directed RNA polymerase IV subunit 7-like [Cynara cardunculus var. scolymus]|uniref:DNA-directed RNA polymerase subunit n=1 Tax=Cynara cardunculus var. scolymus TaxID=59895 RepID=A0A103XI03_CYNCS|nr:DNA-directed RNA polymerase IV subunit 7-like [Cynara cardunculus var. scolymus]KVH91084.1 Nucleic acid-binding, OB-fold [Cynara cardunculus var. scolymus]
MLCEVECLQHVAVPTKDVDTNGTVPTSSIVSSLLKQLKMCKALEEFGYFLGVTKLKNIGTGRINNESLKYIDFLVAFNCRTLLPVKGEVMVGIVHSINRFGVFLKSGPMKIVYLSTRKMPNYYYFVEEEGKPVFLSNDLSRIEKDVVIRFVVFATRWNQRTRDIRVLASIEGESLGPVTMAGFDGFDI